MRTPLRASTHNDGLHLGARGPTLVTVSEENRQWRLRRRPEGALTPDVFELVTQPTQAPSDGEVRVRVLELSLDPANRVWISGPSYRPAVEIGAVMDGFAVGEVVESRSDAMPVGTLVSGDLGWQDYAVRAAKDVRPLPGGTERPLSHHLGVLGVTGLTAYFGLLAVGKPKPKETVLVSGAAGATGSVVVQIAKMWGCRVVGIAGSPAKCEWLTNELKLDAAINYHTQDVKAAVAETCPDGVDVYFDNVGGSILETALFAMRDRGRVVCCGAVSGYDGTAPPPGPRGVPGLLIARRLTMRGFIVTDFAPRFRDGIQALVKWIDTGYVKVREDRIDGLERAPEGLVGLLAGENIGKRYVHVADR